MAIIKSKPKIKWTAKDITKGLVDYGAPYELRKNFVCVPNVSFGFLEWEADLFVCSKSGFCTEVEIKISAADWNNDKKKHKWLPLRSSRRPWEAWERHKYFWYCAPLKLAERWEDFGIPEYAGVYGAWRNEDPLYGGKIFFKVLRPAKKMNIDNHRKLTDEEKMKLARLGAMRGWT